MNNLKRIKSLLGLLAFLVILFISFSCESQDKPEMLASHDYNLLKAPSFVLENLDGNKVSSEKYKGKVTVLNFWATWCRYCREEITHLNNLYNDYHNQGVEIVGISMDSQGAAAVIPFTKRYAVDYAILIGNEWIGRDFGGIVGLPTTIIIDQNWEIYQKYPGLVEKSVLEKDISHLLAKK